MKPLVMTVEELNALLADAEIWSAMESFETEDVDVGMTGVNYTAGRPMMTVVTQKLEAAAFYEGRTILIDAVQVTRKKNGEVKGVDHSLNIRGVELAGARKDEDGFAIYDWTLISDEILKFKYFDQFVSNSNAP